MTPIGVVVWLGERAFRVLAAMVALVAPVREDEVRADLYDRGAPVEGGSELAIETLDKMLTRVLEAKHRIDTRAAVVPPLIGAIASLVAGRVPNQLDEVAVVSGLTTVLLAGGAVVFSLGCLWSRDYSVGPNALSVAALTVEELSSQKQGIAIELAIAIMDVRGIILRNSWYLNVALLLTAAAGMGLFLFGAAGGLTNNE